MPILTPTVFPPLTFTVPALLPSPVGSPLCLLASSERVQYRITSGLIDGFSQWWQLPALVLALSAIGLFVLWTYRRDAAELPRGVGLVLTALRLGAIAAVAASFTAAVNQRATQENCLWIWNSPASAS
jgi:hypothetical protein